MPGTLRRLEYLQRIAGALDPWGHEYKLLCGAALPKAATGIGVMSVGRDGTAGTKDDIESWDTSRITRE